MNNDLRNIDYFKDFIKKIDEAFQTSVPVEWSKIGTTLYGKFLIKENEFKIISEVIIHGFMTFKFKAFHDKKFTTEMTNRGTDTIQLIPTIKESLEFILNDVSPNGIVFGATDDSKGRKYIYDRFCKEWVKDNIDWEWKGYNIENMKLYFLNKKNVKKEEILDVLEWVKDNGLSYQE